MKPKNSKEPLADLDDEGPTKYCDELYALIEKYGDKGKYPTPEDHILYNEMGIDKEDMKEKKITTHYKYKELKVAEVFCYENE